MACEGERNPSSFCSFLLVLWHLALSSETASLGLSDLVPKILPRLLQLHLLSILLCPLTVAPPDVCSHPRPAFKDFFFFFFWLCWVFVAAPGLSLVAVSGGYSSLWCAGFSLRWLLLLWSTGSRRAGFSSCGSWGLERRLSSCGAGA